MSSLPGADLESFVVWYYRYSFAFDPLAEACLSVSIAEAINPDTRRGLRLSEDEFRRVVRCFEPDRHRVEDMLDEFDEESMSWRDYSFYSDEWAAPQCYLAAEAVIAHIQTKKAQEKKGNE